MSNDFEVKDSGERQQFDSGMVRDITDGKTRYDLALDGPMFNRYAVHMTKGAEKYSARNWMQAEGEAELNRFRESALRHFLQWFRGDQGEDHAAAVYFNINGAEYVQERMDWVSDWQLAVEDAWVDDDLCDFSTPHPQDACDNGTCDCCPDPIQLIERPKNVTWDLATWHSYGDSQLVAGDFLTHPDGSVVYWVDEDGWMDGDGTWREVEWFTHPVTWDQDSLYEEDSQEKNVRPGDYYIGSDGSDGVWVRGVDKTDWEELDLTNSVTWDLKSYEYDNIQEGDFYENGYTGNIYAFDSLKNTDRVWPRN